MRAGVGEVLHVGRAERQSQHLHAQADAEIWPAAGEAFAQERDLRGQPRHRGITQIRHAQEVCRRFVIEDRPEVVTVQYTCPATGYGHTRIRFENARLAQIETQGIERGLPFNFAAEARRIGACER